jgi:hypothetical protein
MVEDLDRGSNRDSQDDGFLSAVETFRSQAIELIGTMEIISQQAPLFAREHDPSDPKRQAVSKLLIELANKVSKLDTFASKTMHYVWIGETNETKNHISCTHSESDQSDK